MLLEAAALDGAGPWKAFRRVTLPLLSPASLFLAVWLTINALQLFDEVYLSTQGGPLTSTTVLVYYLSTCTTGVPELQLRLRLGHRLFPVPHHRRGHCDPVPGRQAIHALPVMTAAQAPARAGIGVPLGARRTGDGGGCRSAPGTWC